MPRRSKLEDRLDRLAELRYESDSELVRREVESCLGERSNYLVARAAKLAAERGFEELTETLTDAFDRFMADPIKTDKGCIAKTAILRALVDLEARTDDVYQRGVRYRQPEPSYGGPSDTAVAVRAASAEGLLIARHPDLGIEMSDLLADPAADARVAAIKVLAASGRPEAEPLLRLKARLGDSEAEVTGEALAGLLAIEPRRSLDFVTPFLKSEDTVLVEAAALALGESRLEEAVPLLARRCETCFEDRLRQTLLIAISMLRRKVGFDFLLSQVETAAPERATQALVALAIHRGDDALRDQVATAIEGREDDPDLRPAFEREFA